MTKHKSHWEKTRQYSIEQIRIAEIVLEEIRSGSETMKAVRSHPLSEGGYIAKHALVHVYRKMVTDGKIKEDAELLARIRMKPIRSLSGVSTVTVLTKPHPCPGNCIFCPDDPQLPKSYLRDEPGAARAFQNEFDPYRQVITRLEAYYAIGHPINKIELLILGGSWSTYPVDYRKNFIKRCYDALNRKDSTTLNEAQLLNENSNCRNVGLVIETRPDEITPYEIALMRQFGVTKVQMGAQSFDDEILKQNLRGHSVRETINATALLRAAGFKIVLHWMPNLLGATPESDFIDFHRIWNDGFCPDEIKIYPTQLVEEAPLYKYWERGEFTPYTTEELIKLIASIKPSIPIYSRVNRIIRDIPSNYIKAGSRRSSLRQDVHREMDKHGEKCRCIRCREIRESAISTQDLIYDDHIYEAAFMEEHFLNYSTKDDQLVGYLRLAIPIKTKDIIFNSQKQILFSLIPELENVALIRELHIFGQSIAVGNEQSGAAQHTGLGTNLLKKAELIAKNAGYKKLVVIAAIGTRLYYEKRGFSRSGLYMSKDLIDNQDD